MCLGSHSIQVAGRLNKCRPRGVHRRFFRPVGDDDIRLDFYTMYKEEATVRDAEYVKKYDEDLNTTLIFVSDISFTSSNHLTCFRRRAFFLPSARPLSSISSRNFNPIRMNRL